MKIERIKTLDANIHHPQKINGENIVDFAKRLDLTMVIIEREAFKDDSPMRYAAFLRGVDIRTGESMLQSTHGDGATEDEAIANYAKAISHKRLMVNAGQENPKTLRTGYIYYKPTKTT
jgi:hypothetical protein